MQLKHLISNSFFLLLENSVMTKIGMGAVHLYAHLFRSFFLRGGQSEETLFQSEDEHNSGPHMVQRCVYIRISVSCESCKATLVQSRSEIWGWK